MSVHPKRAGQRVSQDKLTKYLLIEKLKSNALAAVMFMAIAVALTTFSLNRDDIKSIDTAVVQFSHVQMEKQFAGGYTVLVKLTDGKIVSIYLPRGWPLPKPGSAIEVMRIKQLFFGERFVLLKKD